MNHQISLWTHQNLQLARRVPGALEERRLSLCFEQGICRFHLIRSWWLCFLHENRLWTTISSSPPPYQQQLSYPKNLYRNEDDRKLPGEMVRARPVREGGRTSHYLPSFCTAAGKKGVSKSYLWWVFLTFPPHLSYSPSLRDFIRTLLVA